MQIRVVKDDVHRDNYNPDQIAWVSHDQLGQHLKATAGRTIMLPDHHAFYMDGLNFHSCLNSSMRSTGTCAGGLLD